MVDAASRLCTGLQRAQLNGERRRGRAHSAHRLRGQKWPILSRTCVLIFVQRSFLAYCRSSVSPLHAARENPFLPFLQYGRSAIWYNLKLRQRVARIRTHRNLQARASARFTSEPPVAERPVQQSGCLHTRHHVCRITPYRRIRRSFSTNVVPTLVPNISGARACDSLPFIHILSAAAPS